MVAESAENRIKNKSEGLDLRVNTITPNYFSLVLEGLEREFTLRGTTQRKIFSGKTPCETSFSAYESKKITPKKLMGHRIQRVRNGFDLLGLAVTGNGYAIPYDGMVQPDLAVRETVKLDTDSLLVKIEENNKKAFDQYTTNSLGWEVAIVPVDKTRGIYSLTTSGNGSLTEEEIQEIRGYSAFCVRYNSSAAPKQIGNSVYITEASTASPSKGNGIRKEDGRLILSSQKDDGFLSTLTSDLSQYLTLSRVDVLNLGAAGVHYTFVFSGASNLPSGVDDAIKNMGYKIISPGKTKDTTQSPIVFTGAIPDQNIETILN